MLLELFDGGGFYDVDCAAAEAAACHAGADAAGEVQGGVEDCVEFVAGGFVEVADGLVGVAEKGAEGGEIGVFEEGYGLFDALVFADDVHDALSDDVIGDFGGVFEELGLVEGAEVGLFGVAV